MRHPAAVRSLTSVLRLLDERGHRTHLAFGGVKPEAHKVLQRLADEMQHLTFGSLPARGAPGWTNDSVGWNALVRRLRVDSDYLRYLEPSYEEAPALRARAEANAHPAVRRVGRAAHRVGPWAVHGVKRGAGARRAVAWSRRRTSSGSSQDFEPDVVVVTHLARDSVQADYVRAANRLGLAQRLSRVQLGQPDEQGPRPRDPRGRARLEREPGEGGGRAPGHPARARARARRLVVRPLVRLAALDDARGVLRAGRPARRPADRRSTSARPGSSPATRSRSCGGGWPRCGRAGTRPA